MCSYAAAGGDGDLDGVPARLTDVLQVQRLVGSFVVTSLNGEGRGIHAHLGIAGRGGGGEEGEERQVIKNNSSNQKQQTGSCDEA